MVDEQADEELDDEQLDGEAKAFTVTVDGTARRGAAGRTHRWIPSLFYIHKEEPGTRTGTSKFRQRNNMALRQMHQQYSGVLSST